MVDVVFLSVLAFVPFVPFTPPTHAQYVVYVVVIEGTHSNITGSTDLKSASRIDCIPPIEVGGKAIHMRGKNTFDIAVPSPRLEGESLVSSLTLASATSELAGSGARRTNIDWASA